MKAKKRLLACIISLCLLGAFPAIASADVAPGDLIDKSNWEKVDGLLPESVLGWVKTGDIVLNVVQLNYDPTDYMNPISKGSLEANKGKFDLDAENLFVDKATGKFPEYIEGIPFPGVDEKDPRAAPKLVYNRFYDGYSMGSIFLPFTADWIGRGSGLERTVMCSWEQYPLDGYPGHKEKKNKEGYERFAMIRVLAPFDIKGTNILLMRYRGNKADTTLAYVPAIRRVRRMSPANRSDAFLGTDFCVDDAWGYGGKINAFTWKLIKKTDQLLPVYPGKPLKLVKNDVGEWATVNEGQNITYGYQKEGFQGKPWWPQEIIYVKRPTYILECAAKDKYYNYGPQQLWVDAGCYTPTYKVISDRSGAYWKVEWQSIGGISNADGSYRFAGLANMMAFDERSQHACVLVLYNPKNSSRYGAEHDRNDFSLGGFQKLCK